MDQRRYKLARSYFDLREYDRVVMKLEGVKGSKAKFLRMYCRFLVRELSPLLYLLHVGGATDRLIADATGDRSESARVSDAFHGTARRAQCPLLRTQPSCPRDGQRYRSVPGLSARSAVYANRPEYRCH